MFPLRVHRMQLLLAITTSMNLSSQIMMIRRMFLICRRHQPNSLSGLPMLRTFPANISNATRRCLQMLSTRNHHCLPHTLPLTYKRLSRRLWRSKRSSKSKVSQTSMRSKPSFTPNKNLCQLLKSSAVLPTPKKWSVIARASRPSTSISANKKMPLVMHWPK